MTHERIETLNELRRFQALQLGHVEPRRRLVVGIRIAQLRRRLAELDALKRDSAGLD